MAQIKQVLATHKKIKIRLKNYNNLFMTGSYIPYKWIYWRVKYLAVCLKNSVGIILIWLNWR